MRFLITLLMSDFKKSEIPRGVELFADIFRPLISQLSLTMERDRLSETS